MYKNITKSSILAVLILLSIIQTSMLWLGGASSHNFLEKNTKLTIRPIRPTNIWLNRGNAYKMSSDHNEYDRLVAELSDFLMPYLENSKQEPIEDFDWGTMLSKQGILFEYSVPIGSEEIVGAKLRKQEIQNIDYIFLNMTPVAQAKTEVYFINTSDQTAYKMQMSGQLTGIKKIYDTLTTDNMTANLTKYQPSIKGVDRFIKGNVFLPFVDNGNPIRYKILTLHNPINSSNEDYIKDIGRYINELFINPLTKNEEVSEDGTVVFTENMKCIVSYRPQGVIEYINLVGATNSTTMTKIEGYSIARKFIEQSNAIPDTLKKRAYLKQVKEDDNTFTYYFDMIYDGYKINLGTSIQEQLGISSMIELTIQNHQIKTGKWWTIEVLPKLQQTNILEGNMITGYMEPINKVYDRLLKEGEPSVLLDDVSCVYLIENMAKDAEVTWGILLDNKWYYP